MTKRVLLAEDDDDLRNVLSQYLQVFDFAVTAARDGKEALNHFKENDFDICVFDVMMPKIDGFTLAEQIIDINPQTSFIFLTARNLKEDKIKGLKLGADDYIEKPFEADELVLRLNNILKRSHRTHEVGLDSDLIHIGLFKLDTVRLTLANGDSMQHITKRDAELIQYLYEHRNKVMRREDILANVWGSSDFFSGRSMDVFISRLRKYFKDDPKISIESKRGIGLEFRLES